MQETKKNGTKKGLNDLLNQDGVVTHLASDILEGEVKCALESITVNKGHGDDGITAELLQILKDDAVKVPRSRSICQKIWKTQQWPQDWKMSIFIPIPKKGNAKECLKYHTIALISQASKVFLIILQARLQQLCKPRISRCTSWVLKRQGNQRASCQYSLDHGESKGIPEKTSTSTSTCAKDSYVWITTNCRKFLKTWAYKNILPVS